MGYLQPLITLIHLKSGVLSEFFLPNDNGDEPKGCPYTISYSTTTRETEMEKEGKNQLVFISVRFGSMNSGSSSYFILHPDGLVEQSFRFEEKTIKTIKSKSYGMDENIACNLENLGVLEIIDRKVIKEGSSFPETRITTPHQSKITCATLIQENYLYTRDQTNFCALIALK